MYDFVWKPLTTGAKNVWIAKFLRYFTWTLYIPGMLLSRMINFASNGIGYCSWTASPRMLWIVLICLNMILGVPIHIAVCNHHLIIEFLCLYFRSVDCFYYGAKGLEDSYITTGRLLIVEWISWNVYINISHYSVSYFGLYFPIDLVHWIRITILFNPELWIFLFLTKKFNDKNYWNSLE
jgi:hypothetical protein